jgi:hypothetical protein
MFVLRSARIVLSNYTKTKKMKLRNVRIWQATKGIMIAKRKTIHVWRYVLYLTNHPIAANLVALQLDMKVLISAIHHNICVTCCVPFHAAKILVLYRLSLGIMKNMPVMKGFVPKIASWRGVLEAAVTKIISMD